MATAKEPRRNVDFSELSETRKQLVRETLRNEFADFFIEMTTATDEGWPTVNDQELVEALADSLVMLGRSRGYGIALLQTLIHELQDRVNSNQN